MNKIGIITLIIVGVALFLLGGGLGVYFQMRNDASQISAVKALSSGVVSSIVAYGELTKIDGNNLTLTYEGKSITVNILDSAKVYYFLTTSSEEATKEIGIKDLKVGDKLHVSIKVSFNGQIEGTTVAVPLGSTK